ncbi:hypothetical protein ETD86_50690 [Nonomuraea turkmeniaca]|uniref:Uncharacterized protein n=1 Tax=Nonomuraea turkmeniaca TaxID=103838 RepID=A0A5S4EWE5_9ACTN|nr:hypothetical protein [Nonomuraea turkmeniaca]TMR07754.1 hypothetical protein ETD86_50690 [Nonomuraea turkmeniaca]
MSTSLARQPEQRPQPEIGLDLATWAAWLRQEVQTPWRPGEWDPEACLFTADPAHPQATISKCATVACRTILKGKRKALCTTCARALTHSGLDRETFEATFVPPAQQSPGQCLVSVDGTPCPRTAEGSNRAASSAAGTGRGGSEPSAASRS